MTANRGSVSFGYRLPKLEFSLWCSKPNQPWHCCSCPCFWLTNPTPAVKCILFLLLAPKKSMLMSTIRQISSEASRWDFRKNFWKETGWKTRVRTAASSKCLSIWQAAFQSNCVLWGHVSAEIWGGWKADCEAGSNSKWTGQTLPPCTSFTFKLLCSRCLKAAREKSVKSWRCWDDTSNKFFWAKQTLWRCFLSHQSEVALQGFVWQVWGGAEREEPGQSSKVTCLNWSFNMHQTAQTEKWL